MIFGTAFVCMYSFGLRKLGELILLSQNRKLNEIHENFNGADFEISFIQVGNEETYEVISKHYWKSS